MITSIRNRLAVLRMVLFYFGLVVATLFFGTVMTLLAWPLPYKWRYHCIISGWCHSILFWMRVTCGVRYRVVGREHLRHTPAVVLSKHSSRWETIALAVIISAPTLVVKKEFLRFPFIGWSARLCQLISIDRSKGSQALKSLVEQGKARLALGRQIMLFPEGSRQNTGYKKGGIILARQANVAIIPVAHNAHRCWPNRQFSLVPGTITVVIGPPITVEGKNANQLLNEVRDWIEGEVSRL